MGAYGTPDLQPPSVEPPQHRKKKIGATWIIAIILMAITILAGIAGMGWGTAFIFFGFIGLVIYLCRLIIAAVKKKDKNPSGIGIAGSAVILVIGIVLASHTGAATPVSTSSSQTSTASMQTSEVQSKPESEPSTVSKESSTPSSAAPVSNEVANEYVAGKSVIVDGSQGKYSITIDSAIISTKRNEYADEQPKRIIIINYRYENISCTQDITVSSLYFHVYDASGQLLDIYPSTDVHEPMQTISAGKRNSASVAYGLNDSSNKITLELYDVFDPFNRIATYDLDVKK